MFISCTLFIILCFAEYYKGSMVHFRLFFFAAPMRFLNKLVQFHQILTFVLRILYHASLSGYKMISSFLRARRSVSLAFLRALRDENIDPLLLKSFETYDLKLLQLRGESKSMFARHLEHESQLEVNISSYM